MDAHIFVDNSNVFLGAQGVAATLEPNAVWLAVRLYYKNVFTLIEHGYTPKTRVLAGSVPPGNESLWEYARKAGYGTDLLRRVERSDGRLLEQSVDETMHLKIANALIDYSPPQTLILATGDGQDSEFGTSFTRQIERAFKQGWNVVVWSWKETLSGKFARIAVPPGCTMTIRHFDDYYFSMTFVQAGTYEINDSWVTVTGRVVRPLRL